MIKVLQLPSDGIPLAQHVQATNRFGIPGRKTPQAAGNLHSGQSNFQKTAVKLGT